MYSCNTIELRKKLAEKGINTITELSEITAVNRNTLGSVLSGKAQPSSRVMNKIVDALNLNSETAGLIFFDSNLRGT